MPQAKDLPLGINSWLEDELYHQYQFDRTSVDEGWTHLFEDETISSNGGAAPATAQIAQESRVGREVETFERRESPPQTEAPEAKQDQPKSTVEESAAHSVTQA